MVATTELALISSNAAAATTGLQQQLPPTQMIKNENGHSNGGVGANAQATKVVQNSNGGLTTNHCVSLFMFFFLVSVLPPQLFTT